VAGGDSRRAPRSAGFDEQERGYRRSGRETRRSSDHARDAAALLCSLDASPATVAGHSAGAIVAVELAIRRPELVRALVLLDPPLYVRRYVTFGFARTRLHEEKIVDVVRKVLKKMSDQGRELALALDLPQDDLAIISRAMSYSVHRSDRITYPFAALSGLPVALGASWHLFRVVARRRPRRLGRRPSPARAAPPATRRPGWPGSLTGFTT